MSTKERKHIAPPRYDEAFKAGAVRVVTEQGRPSREVAKGLGICIDTLRSWLKSAGAPSPGQADRQNRDAKRLREPEAEVRTLRNSYCPRGSFCGTAMPTSESLPQRILRMAAPKTLYTIRRSNADCWLFTPSTTPSAWTACTI